MLNSPVIVITGIKNGNVVAAETLDLEVGPIERRLAKYQETHFCSSFVCVFGDGLVKQGQYPMTDEQISQFARSIPVPVVMDNVPVALLIEPDRFSLDLIANMDIGLDYKLNDFRMTTTFAGIQELTSPRCDDINYISLKNDSKAMDELYLRIMTFKEMEEPRIFFTDGHHEEANTQVYLVFDDRMRVGLIGETNDLSCGQVLMDAVKALENGQIRDIYHVTLEDNLL